MAVTHLNQIHAIVAVYDFVISLTLREFRMSSPFGLSLAILYLNSSEFA